VTAIVDDTAENVPGGLDLGHVGAILSDLIKDITSTVRHAAEGTGRVA